MILLQIIIHENLKVLELFFIELEFFEANYFFFTLILHTN
jgi:hypothetical protein